MAMRDDMKNLGFHLQVPLCNRCLHRKQKLFEENDTGLSCEILGEIPEELLSCSEDDCEHFEEDKKQAILFDGII